MISKIVKKPINNAPQRYKEVICQASKDYLFLADVKEIESDFAFSDTELQDDF